MGQMIEKHESQTDSMILCFSTFLNFGFRSLFTQEAININPMSRSQSFNIIDLCFCSPLWLLSLLTKHRLDFFY